MFEKSEFLTIADASRESRLSKALLYGRVRNGEIPAVRLDGAEVVRIRREDWERWLRERMVLVDGPIRRSRRHAVAT